MNGRGAGGEALLTHMNHHKDTKITEQTGLLNFSVFLVPLW